VTTKNVWMEVEAQIAREIQESIDVKAALQTTAVEVLGRMARILVDRLHAGNKIIIFGNGGSAADAQHIAAELVGRYQFERRALPAIALGASSPALTAIGNDYGFEEVFARQISALGIRGDVALAISTSGKSPNVIRGLEVARELGLHTLGFSGMSGGKMRALTDACICVPSDSTPRIQEAHILMGHILCGIVEESFVEKPSATRSQIVTMTQ
jgi:D-sedoheptulose 7-phosphate isomerase